MPAGHMAARVNLSAVLPVGFKHELGSSSAHTARAPSGYAVQKESAPSLTPAKCRACAITRMLPQEFCVDLQSRSAVNTLARGPPR
jgi:hypothetical protein